MVMTNGDIIKILNRYFTDKVLNYNGPIIYNVPNNADIDIKIKILGEKKLITVGEWTDYLSVQIKIIRVNNDISKLFFGLNSKVPKEISSTFLVNNLWYFKQNLKDFIYNTTRYFEDKPIFIDSIIVDEPKTISEQKMTRVPIRSIVRDVVNIIKKGKSGDFYLPNNEYGIGYDFENFPLEISLELTVKKTKKVDTFKLNADYSPEDNVIELLIIYNPLNITTSLYNLIGELNEVIAHELEHSLQTIRGTLKTTKKTESSFKYYTQKHEIEAQIAGFKRLSKLRNQPIEKTIRDWFDTHKDIHGLNDDEKEMVIKKLLSSVN